MTKPKDAESRGLEPHWKVRVVMRGGAIVHLASRTEPVCRVDTFKDCIWELELHVIDGHEYGDSLGYLRLGEIVAVTWRWAP